MSDVYLTYYCNLEEKIAIGITDRLMHAVDIAKSHVENHPYIPLDTMNKWGMQEISTDGPWEYRHPEESVYYIIEKRKLVRSRRCNSVTTKSS